MNEIEQYISIMLSEGAGKIILSNPAKDAEYKKIVAEKKESGYQLSKYTDTQVFHENTSPSDTLARLCLLTDGHYRQVNGFSDSGEHILLISKKGKCNYRLKKQGSGEKSASGSASHTGSSCSLSHNRKKNYILEEGTVIEPLVDMGVFTRDGQVINAKYDKFKQINRFIEILDDEISKRNTKQLNVIDFGCGKSYLTFVVYYYLTKIRGMEVKMIGLDLKEDVIRKCNAAAEKYGYDGLHFELGDINGYTAPFDVDMVITLHACDTATDFALFNAIQWKAKMIFSVPCCQHELNAQMKPENLTILSEYGILQERFAAIATDAIRGNLLTWCGYKTQLLEFIDFEHTPKNILIRAVRREIIPQAVMDKAMGEVEGLMKEFAFDPTLYRLLKGSDSNL